MNLHPHKTTILPGIVLGAVLFTLLLAMASAVEARPVKYFIKSNASTCEGLAADMLVHGLTYGAMYSAITVTNGLDGTHNNDLYDGQIVDIDAAPDNTSFDWQEITGGGFNLICIKAGNGRTCYVPEFDKLTGGENYADLNTTSKINTVWFCSDSELEPAFGGPDCPPSYSGETLHDLFSVPGDHTAITIYNGNKSQTCIPPGSNYKVCEPEDFRQLGTAEGQCDPTAEDSNCCRADYACIEDLGTEPTLQQIKDNCTLEMGGPTTSTGYSKGGDNTCFFYGPSGDGSSVQICF